MEKTEIKITPEMKKKVETKEERKIRWQTQMQLGCVKCGVKRTEFCELVVVRVVPRAQAKSIPKSIFGRSECVYMCSRCVSAYDATTYPIRDQIKKLRPQQIVAAWRKQMNTFVGRKAIATWPDTENCHAVTNGLVRVST